MKRITRDEANEILTRMAETNLFANGDKLSDIAECIYAEEKGVQIWGEDKEETKDWYDAIEEKIFY